MPLARISIIIPVLNEAAGIETLLNGLQAFRASGAELIVVDGGSIDNSHAIASRFADMVIHSPRGRALQMNAGAKIAKGQVLLFLHADTRLPGAALTEIQKCLVAGAQWGRFDVRIEGRHFMLRIIARLMNWRSRVTGIATGDQAIFVRRELFGQIAGFPEIALMEEIALSKELRKLSSPACIRIPVVTSGRRWEKNGVLRTILFMWMLRARYFFGADPEKLAIEYGYRPIHTLHTRIAVFAKAPQPGKAKTRLIPALGGRGAARLHRRLVLSTLKQALDADLGQVSLWCAPESSHRFFRAIKKTTGTALYDQPEGDLGFRMCTAFATHPGPLILIGTDCSALTHEHLRLAMSELEKGKDAVFIPAEDGGYVLVGLKQPHPELFEGIEWGTDKVMMQTRALLKKAGIKWSEPLSLWDVDRPEDLVRLTASGWQI